MKIRKERDCNDAAVHFYVISAFHAGLAANQIPDFSSTQRSSDISHETMHACLRTEGIATCFSS